MSKLTLLFLVVFCGVLVGSVFGGEYCTVDTSYSTTRLAYCEYGCCGSSYDDSRECCEDPGSYTYYYVGGGVSGGVGFIIFCVCIYFCCCKH